MGIPTFPGPANEDRHSQHPFRQNKVTLISSFKRVALSVSTPFVIRSSAVRTAMLIPLVDTFLAFWLCFCSSARQTFLNQVSRLFLYDVLRCTETLFFTNLFGRRIIFRIAIFIFSKRRIRRNFQLTPLFFFQK